MNPLRLMSVFFGEINRHCVDSTVSDIGGSTERELEDAFREFEAWWDNVAEKHLPPALVDNSSIWGLVFAHERKAYEDGVRAGLRLLHEALGVTPSIRDVEIRSKE